MVPEIFRALGRAPTQMQVVEIIKECKDFVELSDLKNVIRKIQTKTARMLEEDMTNCFRACDRVCSLSPSRMGFCSLETDTSCLFLLALFVFSIFSFTGGNRPGPRG